MTPVTMVRVPHNPHIDGPGPPPPKDDRRGPWQRQRRRSGPPKAPTTIDRPLWPKNDHSPPPLGPTTDSWVPGGQNGGGRGSRRPLWPWAEPPTPSTTISGPPEGPMTTIRAPHAPDDGQRQRGNGGQQRRRDVEGGRATGTGMVVRWTADVGGAGAGRRAIE